jgi:threonine synthase
MWKAFQELKELGWLKDERMPRLYSCQSDGCAPIVRAFEKGDRFATRVEDAHTVASGLRVPGAVGDFMMLDAIRASGGKAIAGREGRIGDWVHKASGAEGISVCPETAVCFDVLEMLVERGEVKADERVVVFNTGAAQKYLEALPAQLPRLDKGADVAAALHSADGVGSGRHPG